jgi:hypothetical protein
VGSTEDGSRRRWRGLDGAGWTEDGSRRRRRGSTARVEEEAAWTTGSGAAVRRTGFGAALVRVEDGGGGGAGAGLGGGGVDDRIRDGGGAEDGIRGGAGAGQRRQRGERAAARARVEISAACQRPAIPNRNLAKSLGALIFIGEIFPAVGDTTTCTWKRSVGVGGAVTRP